MNILTNKKTKNIMIAVSVVLVILISVFAVNAIKSSGAKQEYHQKPDVPATMSTEMFSALPTSVLKSETVYVNLDGNGNVLQTTVSDRIQTDIKNCVVADTSSLTDIQPISSNIYRTIDGSNILWHMNSTDFIYNGTSTKQLPVSINIDYYLEGTPITLDNLFGKSGNVTVHIKLKNNEMRQTVINGKTVTMYSPFVVAGGMLLMGDNYTGIQLDNGKVISDSTKSIAVMVGFPGLNESLALQNAGIEGLNFAEEFVINMYTTNFQADNFYFAALPLSAIDVEFALPDSINDALEGVSKLTEIQNTLSTIDMDKLMKVFSSESTDNLTNMLASVNEARTLYNDNKALFALMQKYLTAENIAQFEELFAAAESANLSESLAKLKNMSSLLGMTDLIEEFEQIQPLLDELSADLSNPEVQAALDNLPQTIAKLNTLMVLLDENAEVLNEMSAFLQSDSFTALMQLMKMYDENEALFSSLTSSTGALEDLFPYLETWFGLVNDYSIYTEAPETMKTEVMFVYKTKATQTTIQ